jgi:hypothetical protein
MQGFLGDNPFSAMTIIVAPAILTNAMSVLALGSGNRLARVIDRFREVQRTGGPRLDRLRRRAKLLLGAMQAFFTALGSFASTTIIAILGTGLASMGLSAGAKAVAALALAVGAFGIVSLLYGCVQLVRDTQLAVAGLEEEVDLLGSGPAKAP